jgi:hypothetical protein
MNIECNWPFAWSRMCSLLLCWHDIKPRLILILTLCCHIKARCLVPNVFWFLASLIQVHRNTEICEVLRSNSIALYDFQSIEVVKRPYIGIQPYPFRAIPSLLDHPIAAKRDVTCAFSMPSPWLALHNLTSVINFAPAIYCGAWVRRARGSRHQWIYEYWLSFEVGRFDPGFKRRPEKMTIIRIQNMFSAWNMRLSVKWLWMYVFCG